MVIIILYI